MSIVVDMQEWQTATPATHSQLANVALPEDNETQQMVEQLSSSGQLTIIEKRQGLTIETTSYVGRITLGDVQITIHPKIQMMPLLRLMQYAYGLRQLDLSAPVDFDISVVLRPVDLLQLDTLLQTARTRDNMRERTSFAHRLVEGA